MIKRIVCGPLSVNTYILYKENRSDCIVIDPGSAEAVLAALDRLQRSCAAVWVTHGHADHIAGAAELSERTGASVFVHRDDAEKLTSQEQSLAAAIGIRIRPVTDLTMIRDGQMLSAAGFTARVIHTPGHSAGGVSFYITEEQAVLCGDTLFRGSYGRYDFPDGDLETLSYSIQQKLFILNAEVIAYPGHGERTTIGEEQRTNPILYAGRYENW